MVIDLDEHASAAGTSSRQPRWPDRAAARPIVLVAVVLLALTLGGSAQPLPRLRGVLTAPETSGVFALAPSALFTAESGGVTGGPAVVRRYPLGGSSSPWSTAVLPTVGGLDFVEPARVVVVTSVDFLQTAFLDSDSGTVLWRTTTDSVLRLAGTSALVTGGTPGSTVLRRVDLRTGRRLWSRDLAGLTVLDSATGGVRWSDPRWRLGFDTPGGRVTGAAADRGPRRPGTTGRGTPRSGNRPGAVHAGPQCFRRHQPAALGHRQAGTDLGPGRRAGQHFPTVGALDTVAPNRCAAVPGYLACPTSAGLTTVWRVPAVRS